MDFHCFYFSSFLLHYHMILSDLIWFDLTRWDMISFGSLYSSSLITSCPFFWFWFTGSYVFKSSFFKNEIQKIYLSISSYSVKKDFWSFRVTKRNWPIVDCPHFVPELSLHFGIGELGKDGVSEVIWSNFQCDQCWIEADSSRIEI